MAKTEKKRADKYEKKVAIKGTFGDVIKMAVTNPDKATKPKKDGEKPEA